MGELQNLPAPEQPEDDMPLATGTRVGPYEVTVAIGSGGFGDVYRARDTKLGREVAVKVLADSFAGDAARMARFEREARVLASLNHPNIAAIYGLEEEGDTRALILELVEGPTLSERIARGPLAPAEALAIARQIAAALEAAHERGIVHRDLKPANVKVAADGTVKVLDFGLAKALADVAPGGDRAESPTVTAAGTREGTLVGSVGYMSPEQAACKPVDQRADIWAFGCVLFEMLTGTRAFAAGSDAGVLAKILEGGPDFEALPPATPPAARRLLRRCLRKDPKERLRDIGDARIEIDEATGGRLDSGAADEEPARSNALTRWPALLAASVALAAIGGLVGWTLGRRSPAPDPSPTRVDLVFPPGQEVVTSVASPAILSPDGRRIAYVARTAEGTFLYLRSLDNFEPTRVPGSEGARSPIFSPDGRWVGFCAGGLFRKAPVGGGEAATIGDCPGLILGASWGPGDAIVYSSSDFTGLWRLSANGGAATPLTAPDVPRSAGHRFPYVLPDGSGVLFSTRGPDGRSQLGWLPAGASDWQVVAEADDRFTGMRYLPGGQLVFGQGSAIKIVGFDSGTGRFVGEPRQLIDDAASSSTSQHVFFSASDTDTLVYVPAEAADLQAGFVWLGQNGEIDEIARVPGGFGDLQLSPDGSQLAVAIRVDGLLDLWVYEVASGRRRRLTRDAEARSPVWAPDGQSLVFEMDSDLYVVAADGAEPPRLLQQREGIQLPSSWWAGAAGDQVVFTEVDADGTSDILVLSTADESVTPVRATDAQEFDARMSPSGDRIAYVSDETGRNQVYVQSFPGGGRREPVSVDGGDAPRWSATGNELFYRQGSTILVAPIDETGSPGASEAAATAPPGVSFALGYDLVGDGSRFVAVNNYLNLQAVAATRVRVVFHWLPADLDGRRP